MRSLLSCVVHSTEVTADVTLNLTQGADRLMWLPSLAGTFGWRPFPGTWGLKGLPIEFTPAPAEIAEA